MQMNNISEDLLFLTAAFKGEPDAKCLVEVCESDLTSDQKSKAFTVYKLICLVLKHTNRPRVGSLFILRFICYTLKMNAKKKSQ